MADNIFYLDIKLEPQSKSDVKKEITDLFNEVNKTPYEIKIKIDKEAVDKIGDLTKHIQEYKKAANADSGTKNTVYGGNVKREIQDLTGVHDLLKKIKSIQQESNAAESKAAKDAVRNEKEKQTLLNRSYALRSKLVKAEKWTDSKYGTTSENYKNLMEYNSKLSELITRFKDGKISADEFRQNLNSISLGVKENSLVIEEAGENTKTFGDRISGLASKFATWFGITRIVMTVVQQIKKLVSASIELDSAMTQLQIVSKASDSAMSNYGRSIAVTAQQISAPVTDLIDSTTTFARLGYNIDDSSTLAKYTAMLKNVGDIEVGDAQDALTSIIKAFDIDASEIETVMDKLIVTGNNFPISVAGIAEGMNNASSALAAAGNSFDKSVALLTAANTTVQDAKKASTGLRTIAARIRNTKTELDDLGEEPIETAKYEELVQQLSHYNVALTDANNEYRDTYDIMHDLAQAWGEMTTMEQSAIATALAGTRQQNVFFSIIEQFQEASGAMDAMSNSAGELDTAYTTYLDSVQAHIDRFKTTFQSLGATAFKKDNLNGFIDSGTGALKVLDAIVDKLGILGTLVAGISLFRIFKNMNFGTIVSELDQSATAVTNLKAAAGLAKDQFKGFASTFGGAMSLAGLAITGIIAIVNAYNQKIEEMRQKADEAASTFKSQDEALSNNIASFEELRTKLNSGTLTEQEAINTKKELLDIQSQLQESYGNEAAGIDLVNGAYDVQIEKLNELSTLKANKFLNENSEAIERATIAMEKGIGTDTYGNGYTYSTLGTYYTNGIYKNSDKEINKLNEIASKYKDSIKIVDNGLGKFDIRLSGSIDEEVEVLNGFMTDLRSAEKEIGETDLFKALYEESGKDLKIANEVLEKQGNIYHESLKAQIQTDERLIHRSRDVYKTPADYYNDYSKAVKNFNEAVKSGDLSEIFSAQKVFNDLDAFIQGSLTGDLKQYKYIFDEIKDSMMNMPSVNATDLGTDALRKELHGATNEVGLYEKAAKDAKASLITLMSSEDSNTKSAVESLQDLAQTERGITGANIKELASNTTELGKFLEDTGISAEYLASILQQDFASGGLHTFDNLTAEALQLNDALTAVTSRYSEVTDAIAQYNAATSAPEKDTNFQSLAGAYKALGEEFDAGTINSNQFWASSELLFGADKLAEWGYNVDTIYAQMQALSGVFGDAESAGAGFVSKMAEIADSEGNIRNESDEVIATIQQLADGSWDFNIEGMHIDELAEKMGMSKEAALSAIEALGMWGDVVTWSADEVLDAADALGLLSEYGDNTVVDIDALSEHMRQLGLSQKDINNVVESLKGIDGTTLLSLSGDADSLTESLTNLGIAASGDGGFVVNTDQLYTLMQGMQMTEAEAEALVQTLGNADNISFENAKGEAQDLQSALSQVGDLNLDKEAKVEDNADSVKSELEDLDRFKFKEKQLDIVSNAQQVSAELDALNNKSMTDKYQHTYLIQHQQSIIEGSGGGGGHAAEFASGTRNASPGLSLVSEKGDELIVQDGQAYLAQGAQLVNLNRGDQVYTANETKKLLSGKSIPAFANGYYGSVGASGLKIGKYNNSGGGTGGGGSSSGSSSSRSSSSNSNSSTKDGKDAVDWIEVAIERIERAIKNLQNIATSSFKSLAARLNATGKEISQITKEISIQEKGYKRYMQEANSVGLSAGLAKRVREGTIDINSYGEATGELIKEYQKWYEKALSCKDAVQELNEELAEQQKQIFEIKVKDYENKLDQLQNKIEGFNIQNDDYTIQNLDPVRDFTNKTVIVERKEIELLEKELQDLIKTRDDATKIPRGSEAWYDMQQEIDDVSNSIMEHQRNIFEAYATEFDTAKTRYETNIGLYNHLITSYENGMDELSAKGYLNSTKYYEALISAGQDIVGRRERELNSLMISYNRAMASGMKEYSMEWYEMNQAINDTKEALDEANISLIEYKKSMQELEWSYFDYVQDRVADMNAESDFLIELMSNDNLYRDNGQFNRSGLATLGLRGQNYDVDMRQADEYAKQIAQLNKEIANDPYDTDLIARREEMLKLQRESILAAESEKKAVKSLVEDGIKIELDNLKKLIDAYKNNLSGAKSLYDYQKKTAEQTQNILKLERQLQAYDGAESDETRSQVQKIKVSLEEARQDLQESQYDKFVSDSEKLLDNLYDEYETILNERLDNIELLMQDMISEVNSSAALIANQIYTEADAVGYDLTENTKTVWGEAEQAYQNDVLPKITAAQEAIDILKDAGVLSAEEATAMKEALTNGDEKSINGTIDKISSLVNSNLPGIQQAIDDGLITDQDATKLVDAFTNTNVEANVDTSKLTSIIAPYDHDYSSTLTSVKTAIDNIEAYVKSIIDKSNKEAETKVANTSMITTTTTTTTKKPAASNTAKTNTTTTPKKKVNTTTKKPSTTKKKPTLTNDIKKRVAAAIWNGGYGWGNGTDRTRRLTEVFGANNGIQAIVNKGYGYVANVSPKGYSYASMRKKFKGYKTGGLVNYTGLAQLDGTPSKPELVLNAKDTENFIALKESLRDLAASRNLVDMSSRYTKLSGGILPRSIGDTTINIQIDHVEDYNDFVSQLQQDRKFEKFVQSMTVDRLAGRNSLAKNNIW